MIRGKDSRQKELTARDYLGMVSLEYSAMRDEIKTSHSQIFITIQVFIAFSGVLLSLAFNKDTNCLIQTLILTLFVPVVGLSALTFILSEAKRMKRAGDYICILEFKVEHLFHVFLTSNIKKLNDKQMSIENRLNLQHSSIKINTPLSFERWILEQARAGAEYGRAFSLLQVRFLIFFIIPFSSTIISLYLQFTSDSFKFYFQNYLPHLIGITISIVWYSIILHDGFKLSKEDKPKLSSH